MRIDASSKLGRQPALAPEPEPPMPGETVWSRPAAAPPALPEPAQLKPVRIEAPADAPTVVVSAVGAAEGSRPAAAALACAGADGGAAPLLVDLAGRVPRPTLVASAAARALEERLAAHLPRVRAAARGQLCQLAAAADTEGFATAAAAVTVARGALAVLHVPPAELQALLGDPASPRLTGALLRADLDVDRPLLALVVRDLLGRGLAVAVLKHRLGWVTERRALFRALGPESDGLSPVLVRRLAGQRPEYGYGGYGEGGGEGLGEGAGFAGGAGSG